MVPKKSRSRGSERRGTPYSSKSQHNDVFVGNLPWQTTWQELKDLCQEFGDVKRANILERDGRSRGCGVVWFHNSSDAKACIEGLNGHDFDGRELKVKFDEKPGPYIEKGQNGRGSERRDTSYSSKSQHNDVFVGNLPWKTSWQELKDLCQQFGDVKRANILERDGRSRGCGVVWFHNTSDAEACIEGLNGHDLDGRELTAKFDEKPGPYIERGTRTTNRGGNSGNCQVWVGNLPFSLKWMELKDICKEYGFVKRVELEENESGYSKGYAIVTMGDNASARALINGLNGTDLDGREITAKFDEKSSNQSRRLKSQMVGNHFLLNDGTQKSESRFQLYVGNLPFQTSWQEVKDLCKEYGFVNRVDLQKNDDGDSLGFAIVGFEDHDSAESCIEGLNGVSFEGRELVVKYDEKAGAGTSHVVYIGNLPYDVEWHEVKGMCESFGECYVDVREGDDGKSRGYAVVKFDSTSSAQSCVKNLNGQVLKGRRLLAKFDRFQGVENNEDPCTVFVGNLPWSFKKWADLKDLCRTFGDVLRADIAEYEDGKSKGYGTVKFTNGISAQKCIRQLNGKLLNGRPLIVKVDRFE